MYIKDEMKTMKNKVTFFNPWLKWISQNAWFKITIKKLHQNFRGSIFSIPIGY